MNRIRGKRNLLSLDERRQGLDKPTCYRCKAPVTQYTETTLAPGLVRTVSRCHGKTESAYVSDCVTLIRRRWGLAFGKAKAGYET